MKESVRDIHEIFNGFYNYGKTHNELNSRLIRNFQTDFMKMSFSDLFEGYLKNETPKFDPEWLDTKHF